MGRDAAFLLSGRLGFPPELLQILRSLHDGTVYEIISKQGLSTPHTLDRGFREGCCNSPGLYSLYRDTVMKQFRKQALNLLREQNLQAVTLRHVWGRPFHKTCLQAQSEIWRGRCAETLGHYLC